MKILFLILSFAFGLVAFTQENINEETHVDWSLIQKSKTKSEIELTLVANIAKGYHLYALKGDEITPAATELEVSTELPVKSIKAFQSKPREIKNKDLGVSSYVFESKQEFPILFTLKEDISLTTKTSSIKLDIKYSVCTDKVCFPPVHKKLNFDVSLKNSGSTTDFTLNNLEERSIKVKLGSEAVNKESLNLDFLFLAFVFGFASILTPCVFPMLPISTSIFIKQNIEKNRSKYIQILLLGLGIVGFFTGLGLIVTLIKGPFALTSIATNPWLNLGIGVILLGFSLSLLGVLDINLPSSFMNRLPKAKGNKLEILLMGLTLSITSFACIGPFMGTLLASTLSSASIWKPTLGMMAYSAGLALPFMILALFPTLLKRLPKSGHWLMRVKAAFGIIVLVFSAKYFLISKNTLFPSSKSSDHTQSSKCKDKYLNDHVAALIKADKSQRNIFLSFNGYNCTNCHWMKENILNKEAIKNSLKGFVESELYTDVDDESSQMNQKIELEKFGTVSLPFYAIVNSNDEVIATFSGLTRNENEFLAFLKNGEHPVTYKTAKIEGETECIN